MSSSGFGFVSWLIMWKLFKTSSFSRPYAAYQKSLSHPNHLPQLSFPSVFIKAVVVHTSYKCWHNFIHNVLLYISIYVCLEITLAQGASSPHYEMDDVFARNGRQCVMKSSNTRSVNILLLLLLLHLPGNQRQLLRSPSPGLPYLLSPPRTRPPPYPHPHTNERRHV